MSESTTENALLRALPSIDALLKSAVARQLAGEMGAAQLTQLARLATEDLRRELTEQSVLGANPEKSGNGLRSELIKKAEQRLLELHQAQKLSSIRRVINATGVVLHTNLGRAPLSDAARQAMLEAAGYCNLEYDITTGNRGRRGARAEDLLAELTTAAGALIVNNCAAAALLVLSTLAANGDTIVSRGELVEIGGDFRVPEVMAQSGTHMVEVGTTNRTRLADYQKAITENTRLLMRVHTSNYRIVGFTKTPALGELTELAHKSNLPLYEDAGSGALIDFATFGIEGEPVISESIRQGADVVSFSGDKLLGGPQSGLIVGRHKLIESMRKNPLYRALRADKLRLAALEATLEAYGREVATPARAMIAMTAAEISARAKELVDRITESTIELKIIDGESAVGGGSAPTSPLPTKLIAVKHNGKSANQVEEALRGMEVPVIVRILEDQVVIDLRTVGASEEQELEKALRSIC